MRLTGRYYGPFSLCILGDSLNFVMYISLALVLVPFKGLPIKERNNLYIIYKALLGLITP